ncbi:hypothetical protein evm_008795 [Chilo suppressalis]|nr:hypothetical protein evm_008795 [Chilo suppressalis]
MSRLVSKTSRCINCSLCINKIKSYSIEEANETMKSVLCSWTSPMPIKPDDKLCKECYQILESIEKGELPPPPMLGHMSVCFSCGISLLRCRYHNVTSDCPERQIINQYIMPHLVDRLTKVCLACWSAATRRVEKKSLQYSNTTSTYHVEIKVEKVTSDPETDTIECQEVVVKEEGQQDSIMTSNIHTEIKLEKDIIETDTVQIQEDSADEQTLNITQTVQLQTYTRAPNTARRCLFNNCKGKERFTVPDQLKEMMLCHYKIYIPPASKICAKHLAGNDFEHLEYECNEFTPTHIDDLLSILERANKRELDFENIYMIPPELCEYWFGMSACDFYTLLLEIPNLHNLIPSASKALSMFLLKLVRKDSIRILSELFLVSRNTVVRYISAVKICIAEELGLPDEEAEDDEIIHDYIKSYLQSNVKFKGISKNKNKLSFK